MSQSFHVAVLHPPYWGIALELRVAHLMGTLSSPALAGDGDAVSLHDSIPSGLEQLQNLVRFIRGLDIRVVRGTRLKQLKEFPKRHSNDHCICDNLRR